MNIHEPTDGWLFPALAGLLVHKDVDIEAVACVHNLQYSSVQLLIYSQTDFLAAR